MNTTISDLSKFAAALVRGDGLSAGLARRDDEAAACISPLPISSRLSMPDLPLSEQRKDLYAGLGVVVFDGPQGHGFYKGGHDGQTANTHGLHRGQSALRRHPVERCSLRSGLRRSGQVHSRRHRRAL